MKVTASPRASPVRDVTPPEHVIVGRIRKPHGIRGAVIVEPITDAPAAIFSAGRRVLVGTAVGDLAEDGAELTIVRARLGPNGGFITEFVGLADRGTAERWRDRYLLLPVAEIEPPEDGQVFLHELIGMRVDQETGESVGEVLEVYELPQGLTLEVRWREATVMLPFRDEFLVSMDRVERRIVMRLPEGMLD